MARILVVDDDPDILRICEKVLASNGHIVFKAEDAMKAMDLLNSMPFDCIVSDANMPRFSGFELVRTLKNNRRFDKMAIAMLTGLREKKDIEKAIRAGVDDYIVKPIDPLLFLQKIESLFVKKPPMETVEVKLPDQSTFTEAQCSFDVKIISVSELGLVIRTPFEMMSGMEVALASEFFKKVGIPAPKMKVLSSKRVQEFHYETRISYVGMTEPVLKRIRTWIHNQQSQANVFKSAA